MKQSARVPRTRSKLSESVHHQLNMYALAAGAAGVGTLTLTHPAEAKIVYTPTHVTIGLHESCGLDVDHNGILDFAILLNSRRYSGWYAFNTLSAVPNASNAIEGAKTNSRGPYAFALKRGTLIGPKRPFSARLMAFAGTDDGFSIYGGQWLNVKQRYLGLKFKVHGKTHYGWARVSVVSTNSSITSATLTGYAYETIPNKPIIAGRTKGPDEVSIEEPDAALTMPTREPASLGLLAMGSSGLSIWRRKEMSLGK